MKKVIYKRGYYGWHFFIYENVGKFYKPSVISVAHDTKKEAMKDYAKYKKRQGSY